MIFISLFVFVLLSVAISDKAARAQETDMNALCNGLACEFCLDLQCAWATNMGCLASCDGVESNCIQGSENTTEACSAAATATTNSPNTEESPCAGLSCDFCIGAGNCAWAREEGCISSCNNIADCFPSSEYDAIDVCSTGVEDDACKGLTCEECFGNECDWAPDLGCLLNCSIFDTGCFPGAVYDAFEVCDTSPSAETPTSSARQDLTSIGGVAVWATLLTSVGIIMST